MQKNKKSDRLFDYQEGIQAVNRLQSIGVIIVEHKYFACHKLILYK